MTAKRNRSAHILRKALHMVMQEQRWKPKGGSINGTESNKHLLLRKKLAHISAATESADSIVPDTFPDIGRIVCAYGKAVIKDQTPQNDRLLVSGTVQTTVLYEPENGGVASTLRAGHVCAY